MKYLFEVSWEVCNLVGGIHTVIRSKSAHAAKDFGDGYFLLGPSLTQNEGFEKVDDALSRLLQPAFEAKGLKCTMGRWHIEGSPRTILVDFKERHDPGKLLYKNWLRFGVDSMNSSWDYVEPVLFATTCGEVIETICDQVLTDNDSAVAQFHEWLSGAGLLHLKKSAPEVGTVFSTHATVLGRAMASQGVDITDKNLTIDIAGDAKKYSVSSKASLEAVCAREADIFTTVSDVTADESVKLLGTKPHYSVFNGINIKSIGPLEEIRKKAIKAHARVLTTAEVFLGQKLPQNTKFWVTSGRYEYHNKGFDTFVESLARLNADLAEQPDSPTVVAWFLVAAGNNGIRPDFNQKLNKQEISPTDDPGLLTHTIDQPDEDQIVRACTRLGLNNHPNAKVKILVSPIYIGIHDGLFNLPYYEVLSAFDLGVFPSAYEPWGYTPLETIAVGVPTVTTDCAGFGRWINGLDLDPGLAVTVLERANHSYGETVDALYLNLSTRCSLPDDEVKRLRPKARAIAERASWSNFYLNYQKAYVAAHLISEKRLNSLDTSGFSDELFISYKGSEGPGPHYRRFTVAPRLPEEISGLSTLAYNLWWTWHPEAMELFGDIDQVLYDECEHNPVLFLEKVDGELVAKKVADPLYLKKYQKVMAEFENYTHSAGRRYENAEAITPQTPIAYFSMEYCLHECLPIYSGGLGVLSGDHMKSASDLGLPLIGIGFFYRRGYFEQTIDINGQQVEEYPQLDPSTLPIEELRNPQNQEVRINVSLPGRDVVAKVWQVTVGRIKMYLLDTDLEENHPDDRPISSTLYGGDKTTRIQQEIILGMGGVKLIEDHLKLSPSVYHMNEGHCGFLLFERISRLVAGGLSFHEAREMVKASTVFTTHTPVPAGNETFSTNLIHTYFDQVAPQMGISIEQLLEMGFSRSDVPDQEFSMTVLALKLSSRANGVSQLHGKVCREMWQDVWKELDRDEVPITAITNGIHVTSWIGDNIKRLLDQYLDIEWDKNQDDALMWRNVDQVPDEMLWYEHRSQKKRLIATLKERLFDDYSRRGESPSFIKESLEGLNPEALTIGFARRFATYKRGTLLFRHRDALVNLVNNAEHPVQFLFAGKAHPADEQGKALIRQIIAESRTPEFRGKIFYLENYNMKLARLLTQGVDVWLNTPIRPHEASGTSGMKVVPNGGLNCSILDGWWDEGYNAEVGFAIESTAQPVNRDHQDEMDNTVLLNILLNDIVPTYYNQNSHGIPNKWVKKIKSAFKELAPFFSTMRMVDEYQRRLYIPTASRAKALSAQNYDGIAQLTAWKRSIKARFSTVQIERVGIKGLDGAMLPAGSPLEVDMSVVPGKMKPAELQVELIIGPDAGDHFSEEPLTVKLEQVDSPDPTVLRYALSHTLEQSGTFRYALRVVPTHPLLTCPQETGLVTWA